MTSGYLACSFDLLNVGDLDVIDQAGQQCDRLTIGVYSDGYVERSTGRPAVVPQDERVRLLERVRGVDSVVVHDHERPIDQVDKIFVVDEGDLVQAGSSTVVRIVPRRTTMSREVREALAPVIERGVA